MKACWIKTLTKETFCEAVQEAMRPETQSLLDEIKTLSVRMRDAEKRLVGLEGRLFNLEGKIGKLAKSKPASIDPDEDPFLSEIKGLLSDLKSVYFS